MEVLQGESLVYNSIYAKKGRKGPPSANQVASKDEPRHGHVVCTLHPSPNLIAAKISWYMVCYRHAVQSNVDIQLTPAKQ